MEARRGVGLERVHLGDWGFGMGSDGLGALAPDNDGRQEKADESADEKSDKEGNHISILLLAILTQADLGEQKIDPPFYEWTLPGPAEQGRPWLIIKGRLIFLLGCKTYTKTVT